MKKNKGRSKHGRQKRSRQTLAKNRTGEASLKPWMALLILAVVVLLIYSNIYHAPFVFDDKSAFINRESTRNAAWFTSFKHWCKSRSLVQYTFALNYRLDSFNVTGYHLVNVVIHLANSIIVYFLALVLFRRLTSLSPSTVSLASMFAALVFAAHPLQTQAVTFTAQRFASMAAMFYMLAVLMYVMARNRQPGATAGSYGRSSGVDSPVKNPVKSGKANDSRKPTCLYPAMFFFLALISGILALICKSNTASLPGAIMLVELLSLPNGRTRWKRKAAWFMAIFIVFFALVLISRGYLYRDTGNRTFIDDAAAMASQTEVVGRWEYLCTQFNVITLYIRMLVLPYGQNADHLYPFKEGFFDGATPAAFLFLVTIAVLGTWQHRRRPIITFAVWWFFITLSVESSFIPINDAMFEHRLYLPMLGFAMLVPFLLFTILSNRKFLAAAVLAAVVLSLGTTTFLRNRVWQNEVTLWKDSLRKNPDNPRVCNNLGMALSNKRQYVNAYKYCAEAVRLKPDYAEAFNNAAWALVMQNKLDEATKHCQKALELEPDLAKGHDVMGVILIKQGKRNEAIQSFEKALELDPNIIQTHINLGNTLLTGGDTKKAIEHYRLALKRRPNDATAHNNLGRTLYLMKQYQEALVHCTRAVQLRPAYPAARTNLGYTLLALGKAEEAAGQFEAALRLKPGDKAATEGLKKARGRDNY